jgi:hypothetical protein
MVKEHDKKQQSQSEPEGNRGNPHPELRKRPVDHGIFPTEVRHA